MNENELKELTLKIANELRDIGIPISTQIKDVKINKRAKSRLGSCKAIKNGLGKRSFIIEISNEVLKCETAKLYEIIIHELLHTCPGCFNHGKKWKEYGSRINRFCGLNINTVTSYEELGIKRPEKKQETIYVIKCKGCGQVYIRKRMCPLVRNPENYRCGKCGNSLSFEGKSTTSCR